MSVKYNRFDNIYIIYYKLCNQCMIYRSLRLFDYIVTTIILFREEKIERFHIFIGNYIEPIELDDFFRKIFFRFSLHSHYSLIYTENVNYKRLKFKKNYSQMNK